MPKRIEPGPIPLYAQLENILRARIEGGELQPGMALPSEQGLMTTYRLSRTTVREALTRLVEDGVVVRVRGKGTYVARPEVTQPLVSLRTISEVLTSAGLVPDVRVLDLNMNPEVPPHVRYQLELSPDEGIVRVRRQHIVHGRPIAYATIYLSGKFQWRFSPEDLSRESIYMWLEEQEYVTVDTGFQLITATAANEDVAAALDLQPGDPVLYVESTSRANNAVPIDHTEFYFPPYRYALAVTLRRTRTGVSLENVSVGSAEHLLMGLGKPTT